MDTGRTLDMDQGLDLAGWLATNVNHGSTIIVRDYKKKGGNEGWRERDGLHLSNLHYIFVRAPHLS